MKKKRIKNIPALVTLSAGGIAALVMLLWKVEFFDFTRNLLIILIGFFFLGLFIQYLVEINFPDLKEEPEEEEEKEEDNREDAAPSGDMMEQPTENVDTEEAEAPPPKEEA